MYYRFMCLPVNGNALLINAIDGGNPEFDPGAEFDINI